MIVLFEDVRQKSVERAIENVEDEFELISAASVGVGNVEVPVGCGIELAHQENVRLVVSLTEIPGRIAIRAVHGDQVIEGLEVVSLELAGSLMGDVASESFPGDTLTAGVGGFSDVVRTGAGRFDANGVLESPSLDLVGKERLGEWRAADVPETEKQNVEAVVTHGCESLWGASEMGDR